MESSEQVSSEPSAAEANESPVAPNSTIADTQPVSQQIEQHIEPQMEPQTEPQTEPQMEEMERAKESVESVESERSQEELAAMLRVLIANFCDEHFVKKVKKAKSVMEKKSDQPKADSSDGDHKDKESHMDEIDTANLTLSPPCSSVSNYSQTKPKNESERPSKLFASILVGLDKLEIFGSIHVRSNNVRLLSCLIDEQLAVNNSNVNFSFSSASSSISSAAGHYKFHKHRHGHHHHHHHRRHRGRHGYKKYRPLNTSLKSPTHQIDSKARDDQSQPAQKTAQTDNLESLANVAAQAVKLSVDEKKNGQRNRKSRKSSNVVAVVHDDDDSELDYMNESAQPDNAEGLFADDDDDRSSAVSESFSVDTSLLRHERRRHRSSSSVYSEPCSIVSSNKNARLSRSPSLAASSYAAYDNEYRSYSSCSSLSDYEAVCHFDHHEPTGHKRKDKNAHAHKHSDCKRAAKQTDRAVMIDGVAIKCEKDCDAKEAVEPSSGDHETQQGVVDDAAEERRREQQYLMRKYKRKFSSFKNNNGDTHEQNLYLLETSRQHHRAYESDQNQAHSHHHHNHHHHHQKMLNVNNSLVDRLSPISDPDMEHQLKSSTVQTSYGAEQARNSADNSQKSEILNRINNLSPSSSSSSSSSIKNKNSSLAAFHALQSPQQQQQQQQPSNNAAAVLAAAAAAAAAAADLRGIHPHHINSSSSMHNHHAQSVAQLLADMQQQQHSQSDAAKVLAATLSGHHHSHHSMSAHHLLGRFSNTTQSDLMAALVQQQQQQQQQQQHRSLLDSHNHVNSHNHHTSSSYSSSGQLNQSGQQQMYNRYSTHLNAAIAAASAAAAANMSTQHQRRANSVESDATPSPPSTTPAVNPLPPNNGQSISSAASSASSTSENYKYKEEPKVSKEKLDSAGGPSEKVRLVPGYDVFISTNDLNACNDDRGSATRLLRNLMDVFFDKSTLAKSSINGTGRITNTLDKHVISALFAYVKNRYADVPHSQLTRAATDKCVQTRRNFRKKIKAAQSYFGMFPSLMMARPPQLPQASENSV